MNQESRLKLRVMGQMAGPENGQDSGFRIGFLLKVVEQVREHDIFCKLFEADGERPV